MKGGNDYNPSCVSNMEWKKIYSEYKGAHIRSQSSKCAECIEPGLYFCSACYRVSYCSKEHQRSHWRSFHKTQCSPYKIVENCQRPNYGRHLIATRDIEVNEVILEEYPLTIGPRQFTRPLCLGCYTQVDGSFLCSLCKWPMCSSKCSKRLIHSEKECSLLRSSSIKPPLKEFNEEEDSPIYQCISPLRACLLKDLVPENWFLLQTLEQQTEKRATEDIFSINQINIVNFMKDYLHVSCVSKEEINTVINVLDVNAFEIRGGGFSIRGLYPLTAMMNSSCTPNTQNSIDENYLCRVKAVLKIRKGSEITTCYTQSLNGTLDRRRLLLENKYFECGCRRCEDPTENGSHFSTLLCNEKLSEFSSSSLCKGFILRNNNDSFWKCLQCKKTYSSELIEDILGNHIKEMKALPHEKSIFESYYQKSLIPRFHPHHFLILDFIFNLIKLYTVFETFEDLIRKRDLVRQALDVMSLVVPGTFRLRGMLLSELYGISYLLAKMSFEKGFISKEKYFEALRQARDILEETLEILAFESPFTPEGIRYQTGVKLRDQLLSLLQE